MDAVTSILIQFYEAFILQLLTFYSYYYHFNTKCTIVNINCQHNAYLGSIKMSIIGRKLGNAK